MCGVRIGHRLDGAEAVGALVVGRGGAEALEIGVRRPAPVARVVIDAERVTLPDLDPGAAHRAAVGVEHAAAEVQHGAGGALGAAVDDHQVVVGIERQR
jgi:hypothetical protein